MSASPRRHLSPLAISLLAGVILVATACGSDSNGNPPAGDAGATGGRGGSGTGGTMAAAGAGGGGGGAGGSASDASGEANAAIPPLTTYNPCKDEMRSGELTLERAAAFTGLTGNVRDAVEINQVGVPAPMTAGVDYGACKLMHPPPPTAPCSPPCGAGQICVASACRPQPTAQDVGTMVLSGIISGSLTLKLTAGNYLNPPGVYPFFADHANLLLTASGGSGFAPFMLKGFGVELLQVPEAKLPVQMGQPVTVTWTPPKNKGPAKMYLNFSLNRHGSTDAWLDCVVEDTGSYTISAAVMKDLFAKGLSGFPSVELSRQTVDQTTTKSGCVHLVVKSVGARELDVPGVQSCKNPEDCPSGVCREDLTCQPPAVR